MKITINQIEVVYIIGLILFFNLKKEIIQVIIFF